MAINKRKNGTYQARLQDRTGRILSRVFRTKAEAMAQERKWKDQKLHGALDVNLSRNVTLDEFFTEWFHDINGGSEIDQRSGWRKLQKQLYLRYVSPLLGRYRLKEITPQMLKRVINGMANEGLAEATQYHAYALLRKMFGDAIENYQYLTFSPVLRKIKPLIPQKEARHLQLEQAKMLLTHVDGKPYGLAIWLQLYMGLRVGELQALRWEDIDLEQGKLTVRRNYVRKTNTIRDYPKGRRQHTNTLPGELRERLAVAKKQANGGFAVTSKYGNMLPYVWYMKALRKYCQELGFPEMGTHGLRHSTSELYMSHGANRDDLRQLFAHSSTSVTDRYVHDRGSNLERVSNVIRLFPTGIDHKSTTAGEIGKSESEGGSVTNGN